MENIKKFSVQQIDTKELQDINGGFLILGTLAAIAGIVYIAGEIAYMKGRSDSGCDK